MTERLPQPDTAKFPPLEDGDVRCLRPGTLLGRVHAAAGRHPAAWDEFRAFGPTTSRFDHHPEPSRVHPTRAVMYAAPALRDADGAILPVLRTCLAECFRDRGVVELARDSPHFALFETTRELRLLDVADSLWITKAGGNAAISSGARSTARAWARAIYRHYKDADAVDGIIYTCSNIPVARSMVLWERAKDAVPVRPAGHHPLASAALRAEIEVYAHELNLGLLP